MERKLDYKKVYSFLITKLRSYIEESKVKCMVLGISGGIDSTLVSILASVVADQTGIPLLGRSLRIKNKTDEFDTSVLVGKAFCTDFKNHNIKYIYDTLSTEFEVESGLKGTPISEGNLMARLRMAYLYNEAGINKGLVLDTDNLTEHNLGFWTLHGDEGDYGPITCLWKSEVYELSKFILNKYKSGISYQSVDLTNKLNNELKALSSSIDLIPTDGNGISSSDLEQIGGKDYYEVDSILRPIVEDNLNVKDLFDLGFNPDTVIKIYRRYKDSEFKRKTSRVIRISRDELLEYAALD